jgi:hypothetical protein
MHFATQPKGSGWLWEILPLILYQTVLAEIGGVAVADRAVASFMGVTAAS